MAAASAFVLRLTSDPANGQSYDVGQWPANADMRDPHQFAISERWWDHNVAAQRAAAFNRGATPPAAWTSAQGSGGKPNPGGSKHS